MMKKTIVVLVAIALSACSSIKSIESPDTGIEGLTYFMPKKDILITIKVDKDKTDVTLGTTTSYPDLSKQYILRHGGNLFGQNKLDVTITEAGLLTSSKSTTVSNVSDVFKELATMAGLYPSFGIEQEPEPACMVGTHTFVIKLPFTVPEKHCGFEITVEKRANPVNVVPHSMTAKEWHSGIFYRQNIPYLVTAKSKDMTIASLVYSPSESETNFLPISRTFFSNNEADFSFVDGIPTKYKQDTDGEAVALLKLPADIIGAYFAAVGKLFTEFKSPTTKNEATALTESLKLELAKKKYDACIAAINAGEDQKIADLGCSKGE